MTDTPRQPSGAAHSCAIDRPFTPALRSYFRDLASLDWAASVPSCVFVRDWENLPERSPYDIDLMADAGEMDACASALVDAAASRGLECVVRPASTGVNILVLDLVVAPDRRNWAYFEIATRKRLTRDIVLTPGAMEIARDRGLPVPAPAWRYLINLLQAFRRGDLERYRPVLDACAHEEPDCSRLVSSTFGIDPADLTGMFAESASLTEWQKRLKVAVKPPKPSPKPRSIGNRLRLWAVRRFYFLPTPELYAVTVHGPDGVGKSTACDTVSAMFAGFPVSLEAFHHVTSWKKSLAPQPAPDPQAPITFPRRLLRAGYRMAPELVRDGWRTLTGYHYYAKRLNERVFVGYLSRRVMLLDRYMYDMYVKQRIRGEIGPLGKLIGFTCCAAMRRPRRAILLTDIPDRIIERKQELSLDEIASYQRAMRRLLRRLVVNHTEIEVNGRSREEVARAFARTIIQAIGPDLIQLMRYAASAPSLETYE